MYLHTSFNTELYLYDLLKLLLLWAIKVKEVSLTEVLRLSVLFIKSSSLSPRVARFSAKLDNCNLVSDNNGSLFCNSVMLNFRIYSVCQNKYIVHFLNTYLTLHGYALSRISWTNKSPVTCSQICTSFKSTVLALYLFFCILILFWEGCHHYCH